MALASHLTPLEKRTVIFLTIIGILGSLLGIAVLAVPYFVATSITNVGCDTCTDAVARDAAFRQTDYVTITIIILSIIVSFLPRILYGVRLRRTRQRRERVNSKTEKTIEHTSTFV